MAEHTKAGTKLRLGLTKAVRSFQLRQAEPPTDVPDGKEQPGRGPDDRPSSREDQEIISTPHFS
jgi:hypothetical protein